MNQVEEIISLGKKVAAMEADIANLVGWQNTQNGTIHKVNDKVDGLAESLNKNTTGIYRMLLGAVGAAALSFLGTVITLLVLLSKKGVV